MTTSDCTVPDSGGQPGGFPGGPLDNEPDSLLHPSAPARAEDSASPVGHPSHDVASSHASLSPHPSLCFGRVQYDGTLYVIAGRAIVPANLDELFGMLAEGGGDTRYGVPGQPTLYGALDPFTAIAEAVHRFFAIPLQEKTRALGSLFRLRVHGRFADLHGRERTQPQIVADDHRSTRAFAAHVRASTRLGGVLYPSARSSGTCLAVFGARPLREATFVEDVAMQRLSRTTLRVRAPWTGSWLRLSDGDLRRDNATSRLLARESMLG